MSYVASVIEIPGRREGTITLLADGSAYFHHDMSSFLPTYGAITLKRGRYELEGDTAFIRWTQKQFEQYGEGLKDDDAAPRKQNVEIDEVERVRLPSRKEEEQVEVKGAVPMSKAEESAQHGRT